MRNKELLELIDEVLTNARRKATRKERRNFKRRNKR